MLTLRLAFIAVALAAAPTGVKADECRALPPPHIEEADASRLPTVDDLLGLRDIGAAWVMDTSTAVFSVSPDMRSIALQLRRADLGRNDYCLGVYVIGLEPSVPAVEVNRGGEDIRHMTKGDSFARSVPPGNAENLVPKWSPDGIGLAFLRRDHGVTQVWYWTASSGIARAVTDERTDVETFTWSDDGRSVIFSTRSGLIAAEANITKEATEGFLFDDRFVPVASNRPFVPEPISIDVFAVDVATGRRRTATSVEQRGLVGVSNGATAAKAAWVVTGPEGRSAWAVTSDANDVTAPLRLHLGIPGKTDTACDDPACLGVTDAMWATDGHTVVFLRYEGWRRSQTGLYAWSPLHGVRRILLTEDLLLGCSPVLGAIVCAHEGALQPREVVRISLDSGRIVSLFDPNPEFKGLKLGTVQRLKWRNAHGIESYGDFVLPPSHKAGDRHPMVVVQYQSRGFLRGGTGDEFPIQVLAAHGFAVLSVERPPTVGMSQRPKTWDEVNRLDRLDWADFRSVQSSLEAGVAMAVATGTVDPSRVGLTGLSNGASTAQFTVIHDKVFSALALATCCEEPPIANTLQGPVYSSRMHEFGYPNLVEDGTAFWQDMSIRQNLDKLDLPILLQLADNEYLGGLESYMSLKAAGKPVELYVFPNEFHIKWQPMHRKAAYTRAVDWFDFWLQGHVDPEPSKRPQYQRWNALKESRSLHLSASPGP